MFDKINEIKQKLQNLPLLKAKSIGHDKSQESNIADDKKIDEQKVFSKQVFNAILIFLVLGLGVYLYINIGNGINSKSYDKKSKKDDKINVEVASKALDGEIMWRNHFEDKLEDSKTHMEVKMANLQKTVDIRTDSALQEAKNENEALRYKMASLTDKLDEIASKLESMQDLREANSSTTNKETRVDITTIFDDDNISLPKDSSHYIPETAYVQGYLLGGISVSTGVNASSEPVPVIIRLDGKGNLPKKFEVDITKCRILGSSYGDLSSERAIVRAESLICENKELGEILTTKIAGIVFGDDGANGIKGRVVDMSQKHIKNAAIGGLISGFSGTMKSQASFTMSSMGMVTTKEPSFGDKMKDNTMQGMGNAAEKIADYYIRQAEKMSPVLNIKGGTRVDVVFLKGVYLGANNIASVLEKERRENESK